MITEFTKEELEIIQRWAIDLLGFYGLSEFQELKEEDLYLKIDKMIDNYCDHEWTPVGVHPWLHCIKCRDNFNYE